MAQKTLNDYMMDWLSNLTGGAAHVTTGGTPGSLETIILTCNSTEDVFTDPAAPIAAELYTVTGFTTGKRRARLTWLQQTPAAVTDIPYAAMAVVAVNSADATEALTKLTVADNGVGDYSAFKEHRAISNDAPVISWTASSDIERIDVGFLPNVGTGALPVRVKLEVW